MTLNPRPTIAKAAKRALAHFSNIDREMVTLVVATTIDPASIGPASALLAMPRWHPGPLVRDMSSFVNRGVRLLKHDNSIVREDHLDKRWEVATGEVVDESKHTAASNCPTLTVHPIGGKPRWAAPPNPRIGPWLRLLKAIAESHNLTPEFEVTLEATHHGPEINSPTMFVEIGWTEEYWKRQDAAQAIALVESNVQNKILLGIGGGHYAPRHMDIALKGDVWVGHLLSGCSLPMEDLGQSRQTSMEAIGGIWREAIKVTYGITKAAFPGGEVLAHLDHKSFNSWQRSAITEFLAEQNIQIGKPSDFC